jgi:hypothetical protein
LLVRGCPVGEVKIGQPGGDHVRDRTGGQHGETEDVQCAAEERGCRSRPAEAVEERERKWHPQRQHRQVEAVLDGTRHPDFREP